MNFLQESQENQLQEINLSDYIKVIKKEKKIILSLFFIGLVLGIIWFFIGPIKYVGSTLIEIGGIKDNFQQISLIEDPEKTLQKINAKSDAFEEVEFSGEVFKGTNLIEIKTEGDNYEKVENALVQTNEGVLKSHFEIFEQEIEYSVRKKEFLKEAIEEIEEEISFLTVRGMDAAMLRIQLHNTKREIEDLEMKISRISTTKIIEGPNILEKKQSYLIVILLATLGLFVGFILTFLKSYWDKNKNIL